MKDEDITSEFKYPNRWPIVAFLVIVAVVFAARWLVKTGRLRLGSERTVAEATSPAAGTKPVATETKAAPAPAPATKPVPTPSGADKLVPATVPAAPPPNPVVAVPSAPKPPVPAVTDTNFVQVVQEAMALEANNALLEARARYALALKHISDAGTRDEVEKRLGRINLELVNTPRAMPEKTAVVVQSGDSLDRLAKKFGTTAELIQKSNLLKSQVIKIGDRLLILHAKFAIQVNKTRNDMVVTLNDEFFCRHSVATGKFGKTPVGNFVINDKVKEPVWWRPDGKEIPFGDPENILGTRWMSIKAVGEGAPDVKGYGIHGTWDDKSIGKAESAGCIRMKNSEVEQLFTMVPYGTAVSITE